jgi:ABC-type cobalamin/Fe3+-siderophores transport system ATPase subunit
MLIEISDLSFSYGRTPILESISLQVNSGEQWAIIGKNGSGKSTLLRCIAGLEKPYRGSIKIAGRNITDFKAKERARYISYIPQFCERNLPFIVSDYVMMGRYAYQKLMAVPSKIDRDIVRESLALTDTEEFAGRLMNTLSGGEQQRVFLAAAVAQQAKILLLDEPTTFLDPFHVRNIAQTLRRIIEKYNTTILSVSHEMNYSFNLHTNVLALNDKRVYFSGKIDVLMNNGLSTAENLFEVPFEKVRLSSGTTVIFPVIN